MSRGSRIEQDPSQGAFCPDVPDVTPALESMYDLDREVPTGL